MRWLLPLLLLLGCQRHHQWQCHRIPEKTSGCTRVLYKTRDQIAGIDVEFIRSGEGLGTFLQVHGQPISSPKIQLTTGNRTLEFFGDHHKGGQRIRLSKVLQQQLISLLLEGNSVTITLSGYRETIYPKKFEKVLRQLNSDSSDFLSKCKVSMM